ncbi:MAG: dihydroorotate dehydrogenase electron transfer subunit [Candidatus Bathyarchaeia archaeon]
MDWPIKNNLMRVVKILDVKSENPYVKTIFFKDEICLTAEPGQFIMVWIPGVDEIPLSISSVYEDGSSSVTVAAVGEATKALTSMKPGDLIGVRGPFGRGFRINGGRSLVVGGGTGMAPLMLLINRLIKENSDVTVVNGADTKDKIVFLDRLEDLSKVGKIRVYFTTEDGSYGFRGLTVDLAERIIRSEEVNVLYACGPERMIKRLYCLAKTFSIYMQASLERYMRCAMGICGSCAIGKYRVCKDGPVFMMEELREIEDYLGLVKYNERGEKIPV